MTEPELNEYVIDEAEHEGESLLIGELVLYIERYHDDDHPGVGRDLLDAYVENLAEKNVFRRGAETVLEQIENRTVDSETWVEEDAFYPVGTDRVSSFPKRWHEQLGPGDDLRSFVRVMTEDIETSPHSTDTGGQGAGIPERLLLDAATVLGGYNRDDAKDELGALREQGTLEMDTDKPGVRRVYLSE